MHVADGRAWETRVDSSRAAAAVSANQMIACLGSRRSRWEIAAIIQALSQHPWLNTPVGSAASSSPAPRQGNWKSYSLAYQARHNAHAACALTHR